MGKNVGELTYNIKVKFSMWQALKFRVAGIFKNAESFEQVGEVIKITYAKKGN